MIRFKDSMHYCKFPKSASKDSEGLTEEKINEFKQRFQNSLYFGDSKDFGFKMGLSPETKYFPFLSDYDEKLGEEAYSCWEDWFYTEDFLEGGDSEIGEKTIARKNRRKSKYDLKGILDQFIKNYKEGKYNLPKSAPSKDSISYYQISKLDDVQGKAYFILKFDRPYAVIYAFADHTDKYALDPAIKVNSEKELKETLNRMENAIGDQLEFYVFYYSQINKIQRALEARGLIEEEEL